MNSRHKLHESCLHGVAIRFTGDAPIPIAVIERNPLSRQQGLGVKQRSMLFAQQTEFVFVNDPELDEVLTAYQDGAGDVVRSDRDTEESRFIPVKTLLVRSPRPRWLVRPR